MNIPVRLWGLDPFHRCNIKLFIKQIQQLQQVENFPGVYNLFDHPVTRFQVVGVIVSIERKEKFIKFAVDDGTSVIFTCLWFDNRIQADDVTKYQLGHLVSVTGKLKVFREQKEINVENIVLQSDHNFEAYHWLDVMNCYKIYQKKVVYPPQFTQ